MKQITTGFWPNAKPIAVTFSYDDGRIHDLQLIELLNKYGFKGTFHLNSGTIGKPGKVTEDEIRTHYTGHEVALHTVTHPQPTHTPDIVMLEEVLQDRRSLEEITGQIINGMSYPYGRWTAATCDILRACGIVYSRTTRADNSFATPADWLQWHPTCHDRHATPELVASCFKGAAWATAGRLLYIWGHSYEFEREGGWEAIEALLKNVRETGEDSIWAATNHEIYTYVEAQKRLVFAADASIVHNPTATTVWIGVNGEPTAIGAAETVQLK